MKRVFFPAVLLSVAMLGQAQLVEVESVSKVNTPETMLVNIPTISPDGSFVVVSDLANSTLKKVDLASGTATVVAENGSGLDLKISRDGRNVVFRQTTVSPEKLRYTGLKSVDLVSGRQVEIIKPSRHMGGFTLTAANSVSAVDNSRLKTRGLSGAQATADAVVSINRGHLDLTVDGHTVTLDPQGKGSYLWPSISPDGTRIVYYMVHRGAFVCGIDGSDPVALGNLQAPKWLDNERIVAMTTTDDGEMITSASVWVADLKGMKQVLTGDDVMATFPSPSADGRKIAFSTPAGELYVIKLK